MTATISLPATPEPYLGAGLLPGDFYAYEELLSATERQSIERVRDFLRTQVSPVVDDYWARAGADHRASLRELVGGQAQHPAYHPRSV